VRRGWALLRERHARGEFIKAAADVSPLDAFGGESQLANTVSDCEGQRSERLQFSSMANQRLVSAGRAIFVPYQQLATLQLHDLEMVDRRMARGLRTISAS